MSKSLILVDTQLLYFYGYSVIILPFLIDSFMFFTIKFSHFHPPSPCPPFFPHWPCLFLRVTFCFHVFCVCDPLGWIFWVLTYFITLLYSNISPITSNKYKHITETFYILFLILRLWNQHASCGKHIWVRISRVPSGVTLKPLLITPVAVSVNRLAGNTALGHNGLPIWYHNQWFLQMSWLLMVIE